jgi:hypothetical protein
MARRTRPASVRPPVLLLLVVALLAAGCSSDGDEPTADRTTTTRPDGSGSPDEPGRPDDPVIEDGIGIEVRSSQPDRVTGDDALIRVTPAPGEGVADLRVDLDGTDVTSQLTETDGALEGVVVGFVEGTSTLRARSTSAPEETAVQRIRAWPRTGPMISGPQVPLLACSTVEHGLGEPTDANCSAPTTVTWRYVTSDRRVVDLPDPAAVPADAATVRFATPDGDHQGPFVIRRERGVLNRSVYDIVSVHRSPADGGQGPGDTGGPGASATTAWSGRLVYRFGAGCAAGHGQGRSLTPAEDVALLEQGHAVATATFNTGAVQCNDVVSAETTMMVKERVIETLGVPTATIGEGASGGAMQVHLIAQNYPGLLDGAVAVEAFPDTVTVFSGLADCLLLERWYDTPTGAGLSPSQRAAVNGHASDATCRGWQERFGSFLDPTAGCDPAIPADRIYDRETNPGGIRCTIYDLAVNVYGRDPATGAANRPLDNVGLQYGLDALNDGAISFEQFVALNRQIGGFDADGGPQADRHEAAFETVAAAHETGRVSSGVGDQAAIPIIEVDIWNDPSGDIHDLVRPFSLRDRLTRGGSPEQAPGLRIWSREPADSGEGELAATTGDATLDAIAAVSSWLDALEGRGGPRAEALDDARPLAAEDSCQPPGVATPVRGVHVWDEDSDCRTRYGVSGDPRIAAGAPRANDILKCELKAVDPADYEMELTVSEYEELLEVFPLGVCDWAFSGVGQTAPSMTDRTFEDVVTPEQLA